jgi:hypothetical protein
VFPSITGGIFDDIETKLAWTQKELECAEDSGDDDRASNLERYRVYLQRLKTVCGVEARWRNIDKGLENKFNDLIVHRQLRTYHTSSKNHQGWMVQPKIRWSDQPALSPERIGIPHLGQFFFHLPTSHSMRDLRKHIVVKTPSYLYMLQNVVSQENRTEGIKMLATEFAALQCTILQQLRNGLNEAWTDAGKDGNYDLPSTFANS